MAGERRQTREPGKKTQPIIELVDEQGPIPTFDSRSFDENGNLIILSPEELKARGEALARAFRVLDALPDADPPGDDEDFLRALDAVRPPGQKLFDGRY